MKCRMCKKTHKQFLNGNYHISCPKKKQKGTGLKTNAKIKALKAVGNVAGVVRIMDAKMNTRIRAFNDEEGRIFNHFLKATNSMREGVLLENMTPKFQREAIEMKSWIGWKNTH